MAPRKHVQRKLSVPATSIRRLAAVAEELQPTSVRAAKALTQWFAKHPHQTLTSPALVKLSGAPISTCRRVLEQFAERGALSIDPVRIGTCADRYRLAPSTTAVTADQHVTKVVEGLVYWP